MESSEQLGEFYEDARNRSGKDEVPMRASTCLRLKAKLKGTMTQSGQGHSKKLRPSEPAFGKPLIDRRWPMRACLNLRALCRNLEGVFSAAQRRPSRTRFIDCLENSGL